MEEQFLTVADLENICRAHRYILARQYNGEEVGMNCGLVNFIRKIKPNLKDADRTSVVSYSPCDFMTYLTYKTGFIKC